LSVFEYPISVFKKEMLSIRISLASRRPARPDSRAPSSLPKAR
jgi:hypothetical protein